MVHKQVRCLLIWGNTWDNTIILHIDYCIELFWLPRIGNYISNLRPKGNQVPNEWGQTLLWGLWKPQPSYQFFPIFMHLYKTCINQRQEVRSMTIVKSYSLRRNTVAFSFSLQWVFPPGKWGDSQGIRDWDAFNKGRLVSLLGYAIHYYNGILQWLMWPLPV